MNAINYFNEWLLMNIFNDCFIYFNWNYIDYNFRWAVTNEWVSEYGKRQTAWTHDFFLKESASSTVFFVNIGFDKDNKL